MFAKSLDSTPDTVGVEGKPEMFKRLKFSSTVDGALTLIEPILTLTL